MLYTRGSQPWIRGSIWLRGVAFVDPRKNTKKNKHTFSNLKNINNFLSLYGGLSRVEVTATPRDGNCMVTVQ